MSNIDELPSWAGRATETGAPPLPEPKRRSKLKGLFLVLLGLGALAGMAFLGYWFANRASDDGVATDAATTTAVDAANDDTDEGQVGTDATEDATSTTATTAAPTTTTTESSTDDPTVAGDSQPADGALTLPAGYTPTDPRFEDRAAENTRYVVFRQGQIYLYGHVPTAEVRDQISQIAGGVVGPDNVFVETIVDPDAPLPPDAPVFIDDRVLFAFNSIEIDEPFLPILDLGVLLMSQNPSAEITIVSRTDAVGPAEVNLEVSRRRAESVADYWTTQGIDADRIAVDARGEQDASEDDDEATAALNRSVEFRISGFFGGNE